MKGLDKRKGFELIRAVNCRKVAKKYMGETNGR